jgi:hypothetical protein
MIQRLLWHIAGVDRATLATCPVTDKVWAAHLGFSLVLSFTVVLGISFHATGYVIADPWVRLLAATVVALTVFMFDRALYQSDWFCQGILQRGFGPAGPDDRPDRWRPLRRFFRITIRLTISFALAWIIALFLELAIFDDTIGEKIKSDHLVANKPVFDKIESYEAQLTREIEERRRNLAQLEELYRRELAVTLPPDPAPVSRSDYERQMKILDGQEQELRRELRQIEAKISAYAEEMNAEQLGQKVSPTNTGRAGAGPRYQFAKQQKEVFEQQRASRESELSQLNARREDLSAQQRRLEAEALARRNQDLGSVQSRRADLQSRVDAARTELRALEESRLAKIEEFRRKTLGAAEFQKQKDDPLSRMTAYQRLKNDPTDGATITLFSWMTKLLVIFLEVVPVVAKMFFSPPSVYAARIQAEVEKQRRRAQLEDAAAVVANEAQPGIEAADAQRVTETEYPASEDTVARDPVAGGGAGAPGEPEPAEFAAGGRGATAPAIVPLAIEVPRENAELDGAPSGADQEAERERARAIEAQREKEMERLVQESAARKARARAV